MRAINCTLYPDNPYQSLLYSGLGGRYDLVRGTVDQALTALNAGEKVLLHVNWEEHVLRASPTRAEAQATTDYFLRTLKQFVDKGGRVVWTIHNEFPHELQHPEVFVGLRKRLAALAHRIIVHNTEAINVLARQVDLDRRKIFLLMHPSYLGHYEPEETTLAGIDAPASRTILSFGMLRRYKGFDVLPELLPAAFTREHDARLKFSGNAINGDDYVSVLQEKFGDRDDIDWDVRNIPDEEVPELLRDAACVVLPYQRFLTSGVALLCLTVGTLVVAPRTRQLQEVFPVATQELLYAPDSDDDFRRAVARAVEMEAEERSFHRHLMIERAQYLHPNRIGRQLGLLLDELTAPVGAYRKTA